MLARPPRNRSRVERFCAGKRPAVMARVTYCFLVTPPVSVPEKTLEHWASLCVTYRYSSYAAQWWPANGVDIDVQSLPGQPGKAVQLELKTVTPAGPGLHDVHVDLGQLWEYNRKLLCLQPFYAFPWPHWDGDVITAARAAGCEATELPFQRTGRTHPGWWFGDWMAVMTTRQVADVLRADLNAHGSRKRGVTKRLARFDIADPAKTVWGDPAAPASAPEVLDWRGFWSELDQCGRDDWPQLIRVPRIILDRWRESAPDSVEGVLYSRSELAGMFRESEGLLAELQGRNVEFMTLVPDGNGGHRVTEDLSGLIAGTDIDDDSDRSGEPEDRRQVVFINSLKLLHSGR